MALIERAMGLAQPALSAHEITAVIVEFAMERIPNPALAYQMLGLEHDARGQAEVNALYAYVDEGVDLPDKLVRKVEIEGVLSLARSRKPGYDTPALIRARLGLPL